MEPKGAPMNHSDAFKGLAILLIPILVCGCSTVFGRQSNEQNVSFDSNVQGVQVNCSGKRIDTPGNLPLRQSKDHACKAEAPGYESKVFTIRSGNSWAGFGNSTAINTAIWGWWTLGIGTGIGWLVDACSGAMRNLKEENIYLEMKPSGTTPTAEKVLQKTVAVGTAIIETPVNVVKNTASTVLDTTLRGGSEQMGITDGKKATEPVKDTGKKKSVTVV
jgi:hypothetical protein